MHGGFQGFPGWSVEDCLLELLSAVCFMKLLPRAGILTFAKRALLDLTVREAD